MAEELRQNDGKITPHELGIILRNVQSMHFSNLDYLKGKNANSGEALAEIKTQSYAIVELYKTAHGEGIDARAFVEGLSAKPEGLHAVIIDILKETREVLNNPGRTRRGGK